MNTTPPADTLQAIVAEMRERAAEDRRQGERDQQLEAWADELAASAQVREVDGLSRIDGMEFYLHENPDSTGNEEPVRLVMAMSVGDKVFCHRITQGDNGVCKPAAEPVPVAQGIARFDFTEGGFEDENERGHYVRYADHASREAEAVERELRMSFKAQALEASLAACRALPWKWRQRAVELMDMSDDDCAIVIGDCARELDAAIDALRQQTTVPPTQKE